MHRVLEVGRIGYIRLGVVVRCLRYFDLALERLFLPVGIVGFWKKALQNETQVLIFVAERQHIDAKSLLSDKLESVTRKERLRAWMRHSVSCALEVVNKK